MSKRTKTASPKGSSGAKRSRKGPVTTGESIDYKKLAAAILEQSPTITNEQTRRQQAPIDEQQPGPSTHQTESPSNSENIGTNNIGDLIVQLFNSGEPASRIQKPKISLKDGIPLGAEVPQRVRARIWDNQYLDFRMLLQQQDEPLSVNIAAGSITVQQGGSKTKHALSIYQWTDAFLIFMAVYLEKFPTEALNLLKYCFFIRELNKNFGEEAWKSYDEAFRRLKETTDLPWQNPVEELRSKATALALKSGLLTNQPFRKAPAKPRKFCYAFNNGETCTRTACPFAHLCQACSSPIQKLHVEMLSEKLPKVPAPTQLVRKHLPTPVCPNKLDSYLHHYDEQLKEYLVSGFREGFRLGCVDMPPLSPAKNHKSALQNRQVVQDYIDNGRAKGRIAGPFSSPPFENYISSPIGLIPKSNPNEFRVIHDLSYPKQSSVNSHIPIENSCVQYDSIDTIISIVKQFGQNCLMAKSDIEDAFRIIPINPKDYHLLGFSWNSEFYHEKSLVMGASSSCQIFEKFSTALQWIMEHTYGASGMSHILDDFFFAGPSNSHKCREDLARFIYVCQDIGVPIKMKKTVAPTTLLTIYGIEVDSKTMECRLPADKIEKVKLKLDQFKRSKKVTLKELQSIIGLLNFACSVVVPGRTFLRRLINLTCGIKQPHFYIRLNKEARADLETWSYFIDSFNGKSVFLDDKWLSSEHLNIYTDASGAIGFAAVCGSEWFAEKWSIELAAYQICIKELFPIVLAFEIWAHKFQNKKILLFSDNQAVVDVLNKKSAKDKTLMKLLRRLVSITLTHNIHVRSKHVAGKQNVIADSLSRFNFQAAFNAAPYLQPQKTTIPVHLLRI